MSESILLRRLLAVLLCAALLSFASPSLAGAGGCDDPGGVGTCINKPHGSSLNHPPGPPPHPHVHSSPTSPIAKQDLSVWRAWLLTIFSGLIR